MRRYILILCGLLLVLTRGVSAQQIGNLSDFVRNIRADVERLANEVLGEGQRPETWTFNVNDVNSITFVADLWYDNEQLATEIFGQDRPLGWIGAPVTQNGLIVARNIRHDLEVAADQVLGVGNRPTDWRGGPPLFKCDRTVQNQVEILRNAYIVNFQTPDSSVNYCQVIANEIQQVSLQEVYNTPDIETAIPDLVLALRGDIERLADEELGLSQRPPGWTGNRVKESPTLLSDNYLDLETLADATLGNGVRPDGWLNTLPGSPIFAYRYLRYNLELLANELGRAPRPRGWQGVNPVEYCDPAVQNLVTLATQAYGFTSEGLPSDSSFCPLLTIAVNNIVENPPAPDEVAEGEEDSLFAGESQIAFTYLDSAATQYMGVMPAGTEFKAWYRNFGESTMMFVSGENFAVYIDRRWTSLPQEIYDRLPTTEGVKPLTFCDANWCNGPGPTPTPTGGGAIQALLNAGTPPAAPDINQVQTVKTQVSWNNIRVTYLLDNASTRTAQVTLEICTDTAQTTCEPVISIFDNAVGAEKAVISQFNGLNVYEFGYGYTSNLLVEGSTLFSPDVWISDPTIR